jgi:hypothetical protein
MIAFILLHKEGGYCDFEPKLNHGLAMVLHKLNIG